MDEQALTLEPIKAAPDERNGIKGQVKGHRRCVVVVPKSGARQPVVLAGCYWDHEPQAEIELLNRGFHVAYIMATPANRGTPGTLTSRGSMGCRRSRRSSE